MVAGAKVVITNKSTNVSQATQSTGQGEYQFNDLLPGDYKLTVEAANFKTLNLANAVIIIWDRLAVAMRARR